MKQKKGHAILKRRGEGRFGETKMSKNVLERNGKQETYGGEDGNRRQAR
jgi:hypothetical protein